MGFGTEKAAESVPAAFYSHYSLCPEEILFLIFFIAVMVMMSAAAAAFVVLERFAAELGSAGGAGHLIGID